ncbi:hypothetical protein JKP88DRAFT_352221 [Tribonema minus]|uniref:Uncharacterized protein n=1 Tax=Tribonema minus TaxID=303371 RepID=A0A836CNB5_9STRA|nr:hypothetical protein JKP88DRAFT_352221 [Tribonema minus]
MTPLRALALACGVASCATAFQVPSSGAAATKQGRRWGNVSGGCRRSADGVALAAKKRVRKRTTKEDVPFEPEDGVEYIKLPPLPSELSRSASLAEIENEANANLIELLQGKVAPVGSLLDSEMGSAVGREGAGEVKSKKYSFDLDIELPVESESKDGEDTKDSSATAAPRIDFKADLKPTTEGVMPLPDLKELGKKIAKRQAEVSAQPAKSKIGRGDTKSFTKLLELDPEADSDMSLFNQEGYDYMSAALGEGQPFVGLPNSYLQSGHTVLAVLCVLCGFVVYPGFPLTELPYDLRSFLQRGLMITYVINAAMAAAAFGKAKSVGQPPVFWAVKTLVLGGLAYNELAQTLVLGGLAYKELAQIEPPKLKKKGKGGRRNS